jgi:small GTP-binding protein
MLPLVKMPARMVFMSNIFNIAFMAHVNAGKTTLTERLLYETGAIRALGSVDDGTAKTDNTACVLPSVHFGVFKD